MTVLITKYQDLSKDTTGIWDICDLEFIKWSSWWESPDNLKCETSDDQDYFRFFITDPISVFIGYVYVDTVM